LIREFSETLTARAGHSIAEEALDIDAQSNKFQAKSKSNSYTAAASAV